MKTKFNKQYHVIIIVLATAAFSFTFRNDTTVRTQSFRSHGNKEITAGEIVNRIKTNSGVTWNEETVDTFKAGNPDDGVTGVATTFLATLDVLKKAKEEGINFIITHEPTFYNHLDETAHLEGDKVYEAKLKFIRDNGMIIWRYHDHIHRTVPDGIVDGMIKELGWEPFLVKDETIVFDMPESNLNEFTKKLEKHYGVNTIRVIGNPEMRFKRVALVVGAPGSMSQINMLQRDDIEVLVAGESREWETVEYMRDAISAGQKKAMILLGHAISEEGGMKYFAEQLAHLIPEVQVKFIPAGNPFWGVK